VSYSISDIRHEAGAVLYHGPFLLVARADIIDPIGDKEPPGHDPSRAPLRTHRCAAFRVLYSMPARRSDMASLEYRFTVGKIVVP
jgi:hypothetical protein